MFNFFIYLLFISIPIMLSFMIYFSFKGVRNIRLQTKAYQKAKVEAFGVFPKKLSECNDEDAVDLSKIRWCNEIEASMKVSAGKLFNRTAN